MSDTIKPMSDFMDNQNGYLKRNNLRNVNVQN